MKLDIALFRALMYELIDENPFALRGALLVLETEFTDAIPTLAVTCSTPPKLLVNLDFMRRNCEIEAHVKACILHEFLHVLYGHTRRFGPVSPIENVAFDAVINATIHRTQGVEYSSFFIKFYREVEGVYRLLRPFTKSEVPYLRAPGSFRGTRFHQSYQFQYVWESLYSGQITVDDILEFVKDLEARSEGETSEYPELIGSHGTVTTEPDAALAGALDEALVIAQQGSLWKGDKTRSSRGFASSLRLGVHTLRLGSWRRRVASVLRDCLTSTPSKASGLQIPSQVVLPVLNSADRRAFSRSLWSPLLPISTWEVTKLAPQRVANVYLDVSGSMSREMNEIVALLWQLREKIRLPFWAFSTEVFPAEFRHNRFVSRSTHGTLLQ